MTKLNDMTGLGSYIGIFCGKPLHIEAYLRAGPDEINDVAYLMKQVLINPYKPGVLLWDIGKQNSPRWDTAKRGVPSRAVLFADIIFTEK